ncbi:MAG: RNA polymerase sigma factor (sigma-70 family) [Flavobacteriaceae bacterium]|jgi:RNA polymerase sigma factor (sigma-70 family)
MTEINEAKLIEQCLRGKKRSQRKLYDTFSRVIYAISFRYSKNEDDAKDLLQETFVKVFSNLHSYKGEGSFEGWVKRIAVNTAIRHYQKSSKLIDKHDIEVVQESSTEPTVLASISAREITQLISQLPDGYRIVFNMYAIEGYSHKEIGEELGITESSSRSQLTRARRILADLLTGLNE